jgi:hypothetical protein
MLVLIFWVARRQEQSESKSRCGRLMEGMTQSRQPGKDLIEHVVDSGESSGQRPVVRVQSSAFRLLSAVQSSAFRLLSAVQSSAFRLLFASSEFSL